MNPRRVTELIQFTFCEQKWYYSYVECLPTGNTNPALLKGSLFHLLMQTHNLAAGQTDNSLLHPLPVSVKVPWDETNNFVLSDLPATLTETITTAICDHRNWFAGRGVDIDSIFQAVTNYKRNYKEEDATTHVLAAEQPIHSPVLNLEGHFDVLVQDSVTGVTTLRDYKTTSHHLSATDTISSVPTQLVLYGYLAEAFTEIDLVEIDKVCLLPLGTPYLNKNGSVSKRSFKSTEWHYLEWCEEHDIQPNLTTRDCFLYANSYYRRTKFYITQKIRHKALAQVETIQDRMDRLIRTHKPIQSISRLCATCEYKQQCQEEGN